MATFGSIAHLLLLAHPRAMDQLLPDQSTPLEIINVDGSGRRNPIMTRL
ncbi:hypothetical protein AA0120_g2685 [Alternaria tenuissima]|nr:hypothetical protein AA0120_g2685 [Alternaria tenuissima]